MPWRDALSPLACSVWRWSLSHDELRRVLAAVADAGVVEPERFEGTEPGPATEAWERAAHEQPRPGQRRRSPCARVRPPDGPSSLVTAGWGNWPGKPSSSRSAPRRCAAESSPLWLAGARRSPLPRWRIGCARSEELSWRSRCPEGSSRPTLVAAGGATGAFQRLVDAYATVPYADLNPSVFAGLTYVVMFGMMFGDVGHGLLLLAAGLLLWGRRPTRLARFRWAAPFVIGAGLASAAFGLPTATPSAPPGWFRSCGSRP